MSLTKKQRDEIGGIICGNIQHTTEEMLERIEEVLSANVHEDQELLPNLATGERKPKSEDQELVEAAGRIVGMLRRGHVFATDSDREIVKAIIPIIRQHYEQQKHVGISELSADFLTRLLTDCAQLIQPWMEDLKREGGWSEWDQSVRDRITDALDALCNGEHAEAAIRQDERESIARKLLEQGEAQGFIRAFFRDKFGIEVKQ